MTPAGAAPPAQDRVDQILFRWSERSLLGTRGLGPVATSLDEAGLARWEQRLRDLVWAAPEEGEALAYFEFGDQSAVIRREPARDPGGRQTTAAHALVGPGLSVGLALGLGRVGWSGWIGVDRGFEDRPLPEIATESLYAPGKAGVDELRAAAAELPAAVLAPAVAALLADPAADATLIAPGRDPAELTFALFDLLHPMIPGPYTFSTFQSVDTAPGLPRLVFLAKPPEFTMRPSSRRKIVLADPAAPESAGEPGPETTAAESDELAVFARAWCEFYRRQGSAGLARLAPAEQLRTAEQVRRWARSVSAGEVLFDAIDVLDRLAAQQTPAPPDLAALDGSLAQGGVADRLAELAPERLRALAVAWSRDSEVYAGHPAAGGLIHSVLMNRLVEGWDPADAAAVGQALGGGSAADEFGAALDRVLADRKNAARRNPSSRLADLVAVCRCLVPEPRQRRALLGALVGRLPEDGLIRWLDERARSHPAEAAEIVLSLPGSTASRANAAQPLADAADVFVQTGGLCDAVEAIAPEGPPASLLDLYARVIAHFAGPWINEVGFLANLLGQGGQPPPPALVGALLQTVTAPDARRLLRDRVVQEYLATHGLPVSGPATQAPAPVAVPPVAPTESVPPVETGARGAVPHPVRPAEPAPRPQDSYPQNESGGYDRFGVFLVAALIAAVVIVLVLLLAVMRGGGSL